MKQRTLALLLAAALVLAALGATALAAEGGAPSASAQPDLIEPRQPEDSSAAPDSSSAPQTNSSAPQAEEPIQEEEAPEEPKEEYIPDPVGSISFKNLEHRMREGNLSLLALEENIQAI